MHTKPILISKTNPSGIARSIEEVSSQVQIPKREVKAQNHPFVTLGNQELKIENE